MSLCFVEASHYIVCESSFSCSSSNLVVVIFVVVVVGIRDVRN